MTCSRAVLAGLLCAALPLRAQTAEQAKAAADGLVAALNAKDPKLLEPLLANGCTVPGLSPKEFAVLVGQVVAGWSWKVASHRVEQTGPGVVEITLVATNRGEWAFTARLDDAGRFVELPLFSAQVTPAIAEPPLVFTGPDSTTLPLVPYGELWAVRATVGGKEGLWLIDSGAGKLVVDASAFAAARDPSSRAVTFTTSVTGVLAATDLVDVGACELGGNIAPKVNAMRMDLAHLRQRDAAGEPIPFLGLLGKRELAAFEARFDFDARTLTLVKLNDAGDPVVPRPATLTERHDFELRGHLALLRFTAGDRQLALAFDTGATVNHLAEELAANAAIVLDDVTTERLSGVSSDVSDVKVARVTGLRLDGRPLPPMKTSFCTSHTSGVDGIVGLPWVAGRPFALNYAQKCVVFGARRGDSTQR